MALPMIAGLGPCTRGRPMPGGDPAEGRVTDHREPAS